MMKLKSQKIKKDLNKVKKFSSLVEKELFRFDKKNEKKLEKLSLEELKDLHQLLQIANYILSKYEDKKEIRSLLKEFVDMINYSTLSVDLLNDDIQELVISAEISIEKIKNLQGTMSENFSFNTTKRNFEAKGPKPAPKTSTNNLTKSTTGLYTQEYLSKSKLETGQII